WITTLAFMEVWRMNTTERGPQATLARQPTKKHAVPDRTVSEEMFEELCRQRNLRCERIGMPINNRLRGIYCNLSEGKMHGRIMGIPSALLAAVFRALV